MKSSLEYSQRALAIAPSQIHFKFNIAFVQIQLAQLMYTLPETQRTLAEVQAASGGLDQAINTFTEIAQAKNPPYPKHDIEQRANMGRNTMRRQLDRAIQAQREYEEKNASKLEEARKLREAEMKRREAERIKAEKLADDQKRKIQEERQKMLEVSRELAETRAEEERRKEEAEMTTDSETGERVRRKKKSRGTTGAGKRKKKGEDSGDESEISAAEKPARRKKKGGKSREDTSQGGSSDEGVGAKPKKRRKLARKGGSAAIDKFKSSEMVVDSDEDGGDMASKPAIKSNGAGEESDDADMADAPDANVSGDEEDDEVVARPRKVPRRVAESDDEDEDEDEVPVKATTAEQGTDGGGDGKNAFADKDISMVDESVGAAGDGGAVDGGGMGRSAGDGFGA